eukprot:643851-Amphidinium_carterae.1
MIETQTIEISENRRRDLLQAKNEMMQGRSGVVGRHAEDEEEVSDSDSDESVNQDDTKQIAARTGTDPEGRMDSLRCVDIGIFIFAYETPQTMNPSCRSRHRSLIKA